MKFLCYQFQLVIQNIGNLINYNNSFTHVIHSLLSCAKRLVMNDHYEALAIKMQLSLPMGLQSKVWQCVNKYDYNNREQLLVYYSARNKLKTLFLLPMWTSLPMSTLFSSKWIQKLSLISPTINNTRCQANTNNSM